MAMVTYILKEDDVLTPEEKAEIAALKDRPIVTDEDCPEITDEQWELYDYLMEKYNTNVVTKEMVLEELENRYGFSAAR